MPDIIREEIQLGASGVVFEMVIYEKNRITDVSSATEKKFVFKKPSGATFERPACFTTDGKDGKLCYKSVAGELDQSGDWQIQSYVNLPNYYTGYSSISTFKVVNNLM